MTRWLAPDGTAAITAIAAITVVLSACGTGNDGAAPQTPPSIGSTVNPAPAPPSAPPVPNSGPEIAPSPLSEPAPPAPEPAPLPIPESAPEGLDLATQQSLSDYLQSTGSGSSAVARTDPGAPRVSIGIPQGWHEATPSQPALYQSISEAAPPQAEPGAGGSQLGIAQSQVRSYTGPLDPTELLRSAAKSAFTITPEQSAANANITLSDVVITEVLVDGFDALRITMTTDSDNTDQVFATTIYAVVPGEGIVYLVAVQVNTPSARAETLGPAHEEVQAGITISRP